MLCGKFESVQDVVLLKKTISDNNVIIKNNSVNTLWGKVTINKSGKQFLISNVKIEKIEELLLYCWKIFLVPFTVYQSSNQLKHKIIKKVNIGEMVTSPRLFTPLSSPFCQESHVRFGKELENISTEKWNVKDGKVECEMINIKTYGTLKLSPSGCVVILSRCNQASESILQSFKEWISML